MSMVESLLEVGRASWLLYIQYFKTLVSQMDSLWPLEEKRLEILNEGLSVNNSYQS